MGDKVLCSWRLSREGKWLRKGNPPEKGYIRVEVVRDDDADNWRRRPEGGFERLTKLPKVLPPWRPVAAHIGITSPTIAAAKQYVPWFRKALASGRTGRALAYRMVAVEAPPAEFAVKDRRDAPKVGGTYKAGSAMAMLYEVLADGKPHLVAEVQKHVPKKVQRLVRRLERHIRQGRLSGKVVWLDGRKRIKFNGAATIGVSVPLTKVKVDEGKKGKPCEAQVSKRCKGKASFQSTKMGGKWTCQPCFDRWLVLKNKKREERKEKKRRGK